MSRPADELKARLQQTPLDPKLICALLDGCTHAERVEATRALGRGEQRRLYEGVERFMPLGLADLVAPAVRDLVEVRHHGKNTLPLFTHFEKRFCRPEGEDPAKPNALWGYNFQALAPLTGPGYFVARPDPERPEVWVDYNRVPPGHPAGWPEVRPNDRGLSRFVYGYMIDTLRRVSEHVTIGSAARKGRDVGSWFVLVRED
jgi:hypothetical protein